MTRLRGKLTLTSVPWRSLLFSSNVPSWSSASPLVMGRPSPVPPSAEDRARMLQPDDLGRTIRFIAEMPAHACINEIVISPTWNRIVLGASDLKRV